MRDWVDLPGGAYRVGLAADEVARLAHVIAAVNRREAEEDPDPLHGLRQHFEVEAESGNVEWLSRELAAHAPARDITLAPFRIARRPVTNGEYRRFIAETGDAFPPPRGWRSGILADARPVWGATWNAAAAYAAWAGARLPTEHEWERAARGLERRFFPWGNDWAPQGELIERLSVARPFLAGAIPGLESPDGCLDMIVRGTEWCDGGALRGGHFRHLLPCALTRFEPGSGVGGADATFRLARDWY